MAYKLTFQPVFHFYTPWKYQKWLKMNHVKLHFRIVVIWNVENMKQKQIWIFIRKVNNLRKDDWKAEKLLVGWENLERPLFTI